MIVISVVSGKGGVGKTASSVNIATELADQGYSVLLLDLDKQANATKHLNVYNNDKPSICDVVLTREDPVKFVVKTEFKNLDMIPSSYDLEDVPDKIMLDINRGRMTRLKGIQKLDYDFVIIDCPPSLDVITMNALAICNYVLVPIKVDEWGIDGLEKITRKIQIVRDEHNPTLTLLGCFITMDNRTRANTEAKEVLSKKLGKKFLNSTIRQGKAFVESTFEHKPVVLLSPNSTVAQDYKKLVTEVLDNVK